MSIRVRGSITVQRKTSARGAFNVGDLSTEIGEFEVKDHLIEEFEPGKYAGEFIIKRDYDSFSWRGRVFVKNRATLDAIFIDDAAEGSPTPMSPPSNPIPSTRPVHLPGRTRQGLVRYRASSQRRRSRPRTIPTCALRRRAAHAGPRWRSRQLDPTVDRERFRLQRDRLKEIGYQFDARAQSWRRTAQS